MSCYSFWLIAQKNKINTTDHFDLDASFLSDLLASTFSSVQVQIIVLEYKYEYYTSTSSVLALGVPERE